MRTHTQHTLILKKIEKIPLLSLLRVDAIINPHWLELPLSRTKVFMVPKVFEPWKFNCILVSDDNR